MDLELFQMFIKQLMKGNLVQPPMTRREALEYFFEMDEYIQKNPE